MRTDLYNKYYDILLRVNNVMNITSNEKLKELSKNTILNTINRLCEMDKDNKELYENMLIEFNLKEKVESNSLENEVSEDLEVEEKNIESLEEEIEKIEETHEETKEILENKEIVNEVKEEQTNNININNEAEENVFSNDKSLEKTHEKRDEVEKTEGFKIKNIKKSYNSKLKSKTLLLLSLVGAGFALSNPLYTAALGIGGYYLYKKGVKNAKSLIEKNGLALDKDENLINSAGNVITKDDIGKLKYNLIKRELSKINKSNGRIDGTYKKNKLTSMLLNAPIIKNIRNKYNKLTTNDIEISEEVNDMNKGMGIIK